MTTEEYAILEGAHKFLKKTVDELEMEMLDDYLEDKGVKKKDFSEYRKEYHRLYGKDRKGWHLFLK